MLQIKQCVARHGLNRFVCQLSSTAPDRVLARMATPPVFVTDAAFASGGKTTYGISARKFAKQ